MVSPLEKIAVGASNGAFEANVIVVLAWSSPQEPLYRGGRAGGEICLKVARVFGRDTENPTSGRRRSSFGHFTAPKCFVVNQDNLVLVDANLHMPQADLCLQNGGEKWQISGKTCDSHCAS